MKFTLTHGVHRVEFEFASADPGYELIIHEVRSAMNTMDRLIAAGDVDLQKHLPLMQGVAIARYVESMREAVCYDISTDGYMVRHDWIDLQGRKNTYPGEKIGASEWRDAGGLEEAVRLRRQTAMAVREGAK